MSETKISMCNFCDCACALVVEYEGDRVLSIRGDRENTFTRGHVCPKGLAQQDLYHDPDRIRKPLVKKGAEWEEVSWDEALDRAGRGLAQVQKKYGRDALGVYWGNPTSHDYASLLSVLPFTKGLRTRNVFSANSVDALTRMVVSRFMYGNQAALPVPDLERTRHLLIIGANPVVSGGSIMTAPDCKRRLEEVRERGGRIVVIDPRRSETAAMADRHVFIVPGSDALFLLAFLDVLFQEDLARPGELASKLEGLGQLREIASRFPADKVEAAVGMPAATIRDLAREFAAAAGAVCYGRMGISTQAFGGVATWLADVVNIVTGNLGRVGGAMFASPAVDLLWLSKLLRQWGDFNRWQSRVSKLPEFNGEFPVAVLAEEIETPGPGQIKAMVTLAGNPILSLPNGRRLDRAFESLDFMVSIDLFINETTRHADLILPSLSTFENDHYPILELAMGVRNHARYAPAVFPQPPDSKHLWEVMADLVHAVDKHSGPVAAVAGALKRRALYFFHPRRQLQALLKLGPRKLSLKTLEGLPHGLDLGPLEPGAEKVICRKNGRIDLVPPPLVADLGRLAGQLQPEARPKDGELLLISRRTRRSINSWMHNSPRLTEGKNRCTLMMHPDDAQARGLETGSEVVMSSRVGEIRVPLEVTGEMMPGVVSMTFGWGHDRPGARLSVAGRRPGVSMNDVMDERLYDAVTGISVLDGVPVRVRSPS